MTFAGAVPAAAEPMFKLGQELPFMLVRVCKNLEDAKAEAKRASSLGSEDSNKELRFGDLRHADCRTVYAWITPRRPEDAIQPIFAWVPVYDPAASDRAEGPTGETIPIRAGKQRVRYYSGEFRLRTGQTLRGVIEIADEPYALKYLQRKEAGQ
jgi:hypothetical protein